MPKRKAPLGKVSLEASDEPELTELVDEELKLEGNFRQRDVFMIRLCLQLRLDVETLNNKLIHGHTVLNFHSLGRSCNFYSIGLVLYDYY
jgi:hypothetical protein